MRNYKRKTQYLRKAKGLRVLASTCEARTQENTVPAQCLVVGFLRRCKTMADATSEYEDTIQHATERCIGEE